VIFKTPSGKKTEDKLMKILKEPKDSYEILVHLVEHAELLVDIDAIKLIRKRPEILSN